MADVRIPEPELLSLDELYPVEENPNQQDGATFGALVRNIQEVGFVEPLLVRRRTGGGYDIVAGEHRWRAARVLAMQRVPCIVVDGLSDDQVRMLLVRMNVLRGQLNPFKFTRLFNQLRKRYDPDYLRSQMGLTSETAFKRLYQDVRRALPPEVTRRLDETKEEIQDVEGLARAIQRIMAEFGADLDCHFIVFQFGGQQHLLVQASNRTWANLERIVAECREKKADINAYLNALLERDTGVPVGSDSHA